MQSFRTVVKPLEQGPQINHTHKLFSAGSCFSENIGLLFRKYKFDIEINPFGQQYNPASIAEGIHRLLNPLPYRAEDLIFYDNLYHSFDHHSSFSAITPDEARSNINNRLNTAAQQLLQSDFIFITLGTAHIFKLNSNRRIVNNCHKMPAHVFDIELLKPDAIFNLLSNALDALWLKNQQAKVILTVSPVRYNAIGPEHNTVSKSYLFTAIQYLMERYPTLIYYPAYEILMDDLRDYRFYADDMIHPSQAAIKYIWQHWSQSFFSPYTTEVVKTIDKILAAINHVPRNKGTAQHQQFVASTLRIIGDMETKHNISFDKEKLQLNDRL